MFYAAVPLLHSHPSGFDLCVRQPRSGAECGACGMPEALNILQHTDTRGGAFMRASTVYVSYVAHNTLSDGRIDDGAAVYYVRLNSGYTSPSNPAPARRGRYEPVVPTSLGRGQLPAVARSRQCLPGVDVCVCDALSLVCCAHTPPGTRS